MGILVMFLVIVVFGATVLGHLGWGLAYALTARVLGLSLPFWLSWGGVSILSFVSVRGALLSKMTSGQPKDMVFIGPILLGALALSTVFCYAVGLALLTASRHGKGFLTRVLDPSVGAGAGPLSGRAFVAYGLALLVAFAFIGTEVAEKREAEQKAQKAADAGAAMRAALQAADEKALATIARTDAGWDRVYPSLDGLAPMPWAIAQGRVDLVQMLLRTPDPASGKAQARFLSDATGRGNLEIATLLLDAGAQPSGEPLVAAATKGHRRMVDLLLARGADPRVDSRSVLIGALESKDLSLLTLLLDRGADPKAADGLPALSYAAFHDEGPALEALLAHGAPIDFQDAWGVCALGHAVSFANAAGIRFLLAKGANPSLQDKEGKTPLMKAVDKGLVEIAALLAPHTDLSLRTNDKRSRTALGIARMRRNDELVALLVAARAPE